MKNLFIPLKKILSLEMIYLLLLVACYIIIDQNFNVYAKNTPADLIKLIKKIPETNNNSNYFVITETSPKTIKDILKTDNVLGIDSVINKANPEYFETAFNFIKNKYKLPLYLIVNSDNNIFKDSFQSEGLDFPFIRIYEIGNQNESYTLYFFKPKN